MLLSKVQSRIQEWLSQQENTIHVCGVSLGGSLSLLLAIDTGNYKLSRVDALNPPGFYDPLFKNKFDYWDELIDQPKVVVQKQGADPVSAFGIWKKDWVVLQVTPPGNKKGPNAFCDHCLNYAGFADTEFRHVAAEYDNSQRSTHHLLFNAIARSLIYFYILLPYTYAARPLGYYAWNRFNSKNPESTSSRDVFDVPKMHHPALPRNTSMDIYNTNNSVEMSLSYQQLYTYYKVIRCMLKGKSFLPGKEQESKHVNGMTKKALLEESMDPHKAEVIVPFKATKAKATYIRHTLTLVYQLGLDNKEKLKSALEKQYNTYHLGKQ